MMLPLLISSVLLIFPGSVLADTCSTVEALSYINVTRSLDLAYIEEQSQYWSTSCSALVPSCIIFPKSAEEVSTVVSILANTTERFAVKSGGHNPNNGFSSVQGGPLIVTEHLDQANVNQATGVIDVGPIALFHHFVRVTATNSRACWFNIATSGSSRLNCGSTHAGALDPGDPGVG